MNLGTLNISLKAIGNNWKKLNQISNPTSNTSAVVKADAYGLGVEKVANYLWKVGVKTFFVSTVEEAVELRQLTNEEAKIYYLNGFSKTDKEAVNEFNVIPVLNSINQIHAFKHKNIKKKIVIQFDIGMNRLGLKKTDIEAFGELINPSDVKLVLGHLSSADDINAVETEEQYDQFVKFSRLLPVAQKSLAATAGILLDKKFHFDITRPGIGLYGGAPFEKAEPVVMLDLPIIQTKTITKNEGVGYNHTFVAKKTMKIATVGSGYADGLFRFLSNKGVLYSDRIKCPIIGRVSMDLITVDISSLKIIPKTLQALNVEQSIDDLAKYSNTIGYEILTSLGARYKRIYNYT